jgi:hypothetical protein
MVGTNEFDWLPGFVQVERHRQLKGIECSKILGQSDPSNQPLGRLEVTGSQPDYLQASRRHIAAKSARQFLKIRRVELADPDLFGEY